MASRPRTSDGLIVLIDSNVFIALEELGVTNDAHSRSAAVFARLATRIGASIAVSDGTRADIMRSHGAIRRSRQDQLTKYFVLGPVPHDPIFAHKAGFPPIRSANDDADLNVLTTLAAGAADWLVTQDARLHKRAMRAGLGDRVFSLHEVLDTLDLLITKPSGLPTVETVAGYQIDLTSSIFDGLRADDPEFEVWWRERVARTHRDVIVLGSETDPEGIAVLKIEADEPHGMPGPVLKICTFITSDAYHGSKRGELLLRAAIDYARQNRCEQIYLEVLPSKEALLSWLTSFGFSIAGESTTPRGEQVVVKTLVPPDSAYEMRALEFNIAYGPGALLVKRAHLVPIQPVFHRRLFPDAEEQLMLFPRLEACGNSIRKAYLCHAKTRSILAGDALVFLRTGGNTHATAIGVAEETCVARHSEVIAAFVGSRTVYSIEEIRDLCEGGEVLAILFRLDRVLSPPWSMRSLKSGGLLRRSPQSIQQVKGEACEWIRQRLAG